MKALESKNAGWFLLPRKQSSDCNMTIVVQRFEERGNFEEHRHDLEQFFYVTKGRLEMRIGDVTAEYDEGEFVSVDRKVVPVRRLVLSPEESRFLNLSTVGLLPLILLVMAGGVWWRRR